MRKIPICGAEKHRTGGPPNSGCGTFLVPGLKMGPKLKVLLSNGGGWDHVSVSTSHRCPTWDEMEYVRRLFFQDSETVMQLSVPRAEHINNHEFVLHLWRPQTDEEIAVVRQEWELAGEGWPFPALKSPGVIPRPPSDFV